MSELAKCDPRKHSMPFKLFERAQRKRNDEGVISAKRAVVLLSDTALTSIGGLGPVGHRRLPASGRQPTQLKEYAGSYPLTPNFGLHIFASGPQLFAQGTNPRSLKLASVERDVFVAESVCPEIDFARDVGDKVISLTLKQRGKILRGERHQDAATDTGEH